MEVCGLCGGVMEPPNDVFRYHTHEDLCLQRIDRDRPNACCNELANLVSARSAEMEKGWSTVKIFIERCRVCDRKHYIAIADPGAIGLKVAGL